MSDKITNGGSKLAVGAAASFLASHARGIITAALVAFIGFHGWETFTTAQQLRSDLVARRAETGKAIAEAVALNETIKKMTIERPGKLAELQKLQADADAAKADADAAAQSIDDAPARLAQLQAELTQKQAEAATAKADADAAEKSINNISTIIAQKKAKVTRMESYIKKSSSKISDNIASLRAPIELHNEHIIVQDLKPIEGQKQPEKVQ